MGGSNKYFVNDWYTVVYRDDAEPVYTTYGADRVAAVRAFNGLNEAAASSVHFKRIDMYGPKYNLLAFSDVVNSVVKTTLY